MAAALLVPACGGGGSPDVERAEGMSASTMSTASTTSTTTGDEVTTTVAAEDHPDGLDAGIAAAAVLRRSDVPTDWTARPVDDENGDEVVLLRVADCLGIDVDALSGGSATAESPILVTPGDHEISNSVAVFETEAEAASRFELVSSETYQTCLRDVVTRLLEERVTGTIVLGTPTVDRGTPQDLADEATAVRLTIPFEVDGVSVAAYQEFVIVRLGRAATIVTSFGVQTPLDGEDLAHLARVVVDRLASALDEA